MVNYMKTNISFGDTTFKNIHSLISVDLAGFTLEFLE